MFRRIILFITLALPLWSRANVSEYVQPMMGTGWNGRIVPIACVPFGMVQLGPDTHFCGSGYHYSHGALYGFSHTHKSGGGGSDFQDISFLPLTGDSWESLEVFPAAPQAAFSHDEEHPQPGYYRVRLSESDIQAELSATDRCGVHRYTYPKGEKQFLAIDLKKGCSCGCTIFPEDDYDTVFASRIEIVDKYTVRGYRHTHGWAPTQHVFFYAQFSKPILSFQPYDHRHLQHQASEAEGTDVRALLQFDASDSEPLLANVGISPVSMEGAQKNLKKEVGHRSFDEIRQEAMQKWEGALSCVQIDDDKLEQKQVFYSSLYFALQYPQLYSDVDGRYRSSDSQVYKGNFRYYGGVLSLWDTFRAQNPLVAILYPQVARDVMKTFLAHYDHCGQLPIWTLAGVEDMCMIGYHSMPVIADTYAKGIRGFDAERLFEAMKASACRDTFGYFLHDYRGSRNYLKYHYVPCDKEITSVSKTLEYCYDDWCIAQMARMLGHEDDYKEYMERSSWYKNVFDSRINFMRGKNSDGTWRENFDPFFSNHYHEGDDFCEGTSWQWNYFAPHDPEGLIGLFGGRQAFCDKLDSLFMASMELHGDHPAGDITGMIGQYAHGNEPSHHTIYMYDFAGQPWKAQKYLSDVCYDLYHPTPEGICGNEDCGQMSAWFVFTAMGFYPVTHGQGNYNIGTPLFRKLTLKHPKGTLTVLAPNVSRTNCYIQSIRLNGKPHKSFIVNDRDLFQGNATLEFEMGATPRT